MKIALKLLVLCLALLPSGCRIPELTDADFDETIEKYQETPLLLSFYVTDCKERPNKFISLLPTWELLHEEMEGELFKFYFLNMSGRFLIRAYFP